MMKRLAAAAAAASFAAAFHPALAETTLHVMSWQPAYVAGTPYWDKTVAGFEAENPKSRSRAISSRSASTCPP